MLGGPPIGRRDTAEPSPAIRWSEMARCLLSGWRCRDDAASPPRAWCPFCRARSPRWCCSFMRCLRSRSRPQIPRAHARRSSRPNEPTRSPSSGPSASHRWSTPSIGWWSAGSAKDSIPARAPMAPQIVLGGMRPGQGFTAGSGIVARISGPNVLAIAPRREQRCRAPICSTSISISRASRPNERRSGGTRSTRAPRTSTSTGSETPPKENRTSFAYDDLTTDVDAVLSGAATPGRLGFTTGYLHADSGRGHDDFTPIDEVFPPEEIPGFDEDTQFTRIGAFVDFDYRDSKTGPRSGGVLRDALSRVLGHRSQDVCLSPDRVRVPAVHSLLQQGSRHRDPLRRRVVIPQRRE